MQDDSSYVSTWTPKTSLTDEQPTTAEAPQPKEDSAAAVPAAPPEKHVFGERTLATLERLLSLLSAFEVVVWMTDGWPLYESRLKGKLHVISKRYTQRIERHNLNLRQHLARLGRKSLSFSKSVELHDKVIGHYLNIKHYH